MKPVSLCLACLMIIVVNAEEKKFEQTNPQDNDVVNYGERLPDKSSDKRWIQQPSGFQNAVVEDHPSSVVYQTPPTRSYKTHAPEYSNSDAERASREKFEKGLAIKDGIHQVLMKALKPKPIVDTATEQEKNAPNTGYVSQILGDIIVKGSERISKMISTAIDVPKQAFNSFSKSITEALNQFGASLVGI